MVKTCIDRIKVSGASFKFKRMTRFLAENYKRNWSFGTGRSSRGTEKNDFSGTSNGRPIGIIKRKQREKEIEERRQMYIEVHFMNAHLEITN